MHDAVVEEIWRVENFGLWQKYVQHAEGMEAIIVDTANPPRQQPQPSTYGRQFNWDTAEDQLQNRTTGGSGKPDSGHERRTPVVAYG